MDTKLGEAKVHLSLSHDSLAKMMNDVLDGFVNRTENAFEKVAAVTPDASLADLLRGPLAKFPTEYVKTLRISGSFKRFIGFGEFLNSFFTWGYLDANVKLVQGASVGEAEEFALAQFGKRVDAFVVTYMNGEYAMYEKIYSRYAHALSVLESFEAYGNQVSTNPPHETPLYLITDIGNAYQYLLVDYDIFQASYFRYPSATDL